MQSELDNIQSYMTTEEEFEKKVENINTAEIIVLRNLTKFPIYNKDFALPDMTVGLNHQGYARALYDMHEISFTKNELAVVLPNHLLCPLESSKDYSITLIILSGKFVDEMKHRTLTHDYSKFHIDPSTHLTDEQVSQFMKIVDVVEMVSNMTEEQLPNRHEMLIYLVGVAFELLNTFRKHQDVSRESSRNNVLFNEFCDLLSENYRKTREVSFYAEQLNLSPKYFSKIILDTVGISAGGWIDEYVATQAKQILNTRIDMNIQQVAFYLGFKEQSDFCRFFKRTVGMTPKQFRKQPKDQKD